METSEQESQYNPNMHNNHTVTSKGWLKILEKIANDEIWKPVPQVNLACNKIITFPSYCPLDNYINGYC